jgi:tetratricopeptide (TPR) repeat protein
MMTKTRSTNQLNSSLSQCVLLILFSMNAVAQQESWNPTPAELLSMPPYCTAKVNNSPDAAHWRSVLGEDFMHMHHYCRGLALISRSYTIRNKIDRDLTLRTAAGEFAYTLQHSKPEFMMIPEIHLNQGIALALKKDSAAITSLNKAIQLNPHLVQAYTTLADFYMTLNNNNKALEIISAGLQINPEVKSLQRKYSKLGGKEPYPKAKEIEPNNKRASELGDSLPPPTGQNQTQPSKQLPLQENVKTEIPTTNSAKKSNSTDIPNKDALVNPYCRFCP